MMSIADWMPLEVPEAPRAVLAKAGESMILAWTRPPGVLNGYRVESSRDGGPWFAISGWFDAGQQSMDVGNLGESKVHFRVRAFNDAGAGVYSAPAGLLRNKRRSAR